MVAFKLGVYGIECSQSGSPPVAYDLGVMFDPAYQYSFLRYWREVTCRTREIEATVHPWINLGTSAAVVSALDGDPATGIERRRVGAGNAIGYLNAHFKNSPPSAFDGLVIFVTGQPNPPATGGTTGVRRDGRTYTVSYLGLASQYDFIAHEIGHVLGYGHSAGPAHSIDVWGTYDNPVDIMSARRFGNRAPCFAIPVADQKFANASLWGEAGPGLSPASLWRWAGSHDVLARFAAPAVPWVRQLAAKAPPTHITLYRAGSVANMHRPVLAAIPSAGPSPRWTTVEYRPAVEWDRSLGRGGNTPEAGIVVQTILREDGAPKDGPVDRVFYEGTLALPGDGDRDWTNGRIGVRVLDYTDDAVSLLVGARLPTVHVVELSLDSEISGESYRPGGKVTLPRIGPNCREATFQLQRFEDAYAVSAVADYAGFNDPVLQFEVNGHRTSRRVSPNAGPSAVEVLTLNVAVSVPSPDQGDKTVMKSIDVRVYTDRNTAHFSIPPGDGEYSLSFGVSVSEQANAAAALAYARVDEKFYTLRYVLPPEAIEGQVACINAMWKVMPDLKIKFDHPNYLQDFFSDHDSVELGPVIAALVEESRVDPVAGNRLLAGAAEQLNMSTTELRQLGKNLGRPI
jgi:hypothetical protein